MTILLQGRTLFRCIHSGRLSHPDQGTCCFSCGQEAFLVLQKTNLDKSDETYPLTEISGFCFLIGRPGHRLRLPIGVAVKVKLKTIEGLSGIRAYELNG
jgi:hypothetical protein